MYTFIKFALLCTDRTTAGLYFNFRATESAGEMEFYNTKKPERINIFQIICCNHDNKTTRIDMGSISIKSGLATSVGSNRLEPLEPTPISQAVQMLCICNVSSLVNNLYSLLHTTHLMLQIEILLDHKR